MGSGDVGEEIHRRTDTSNMVQDGDTETGEGYCVCLCRYRPIEEGVKETPEQHGCLPDPGLDTNHTCFHRDPLLTREEKLKRLLSNSDRNSSK